jgi:hypothetical protein
MKNINNIEVIDHEIVKPLPQALEDLKLSCLKCMKPIEEIPNCEICNGHTVVDGKELLELLRNE